MRWVRTLPPIPTHSLKKKHFRPVPTVWRRRYGAAHRSEFLSLQKISKIDAVVIPAGEVDEPLAHQHPISSEQSGPTGRWSCRSIGPSIKNGFMRSTTWAISATSWAVRPKHFNFEIAKHECRVSPAALSQ